MTNLKAAIIGIWDAEQSNAELEEIRETNLALIQQLRNVIANELSTRTLERGHSHHVKVDDKVVMIGHNGLILQVDDLIYAE
jgi:hypothetical protein